MKKTIAAFFALLGSVVGVAAQGNEWITYTSAAGRYSVSMPQDPKVSVQAATTPTGEELPQYQASSADGNGVLVIGHFDIGAMTFSLDKARDGMVTALSGTLMGEETISLGGSPGRSLKLLAKFGEYEFINRARFFEVGKRIYVLQCIFPKREESPAIAEKCAKFLDSFKVEPR